jgi:indolepyruvate decarboxylase
VNQFLQPGDIVVLDVGVSASLGGIKLALPDGVDIETQSAWGAIGWGSAAALGTAIASPDRRTVLIGGEGGHQMTANDLGTMARYGAAPIIIMINNNGYLAESVTCRYPDEEYNDLAPWQYYKLPEVLGCDDWFCKRVTTLAELDAALSEAGNGGRGCYIEVVTDKYALPVGAEWVFAATRPKFNQAGLSWETWVANHES